MLHTFAGVQTTTVSFGANGGARPTLLNPVCTAYAGSVVTTAPSLNAGGTVHGLLLLLLLFDDDAAAGDAHASAASTAANSVAASSAAIVEVRARNGARNGARRQWSAQWSAR